MTNEDRGACRMEGPMSDEVSDTEIEAIFARIDEACERLTAQHGGDEIKAMGDASTELHDLIALRAALLEARTQRTDAWEDEDLARAGQQGAQEERDALRTALDVMQGERDVARLGRATAWEDLARIGRFVGCDSLVGEEIFAAVEDALVHEPAFARTAAERAERDLDVMRRQQAPLLASHDALCRAAGLPGAGASAEEMVAAVRAKARREARDAALRECLDIAESELRRYNSRERDVKLTLEERGVAWERAAAVEAIVDEIRDLPLLGDVEVSRG